MREPPLRVAVDVGGTFTDIVLTSGDEVIVKKLLSTPADYSEAMVRGIRALLLSEGRGAADLSAVVHAATVGSNTVATLSGGPTGLLVTKGFGDILEIGRMSLPIQNNLRWMKRPPLAERWHVVELNERVASDGEIIRALDVEEALRAVGALQTAGVESLAVCLINSYANPTHEECVRGLVEENFPELSVSLSSEVSPEIGEYERASTTVIDAYIKPTISRYLVALERRLHNQGYRGRLFIMQSNGGLATSDIVRSRPSYALESGPVAGVIGTLKRGDQAGLTELIAFDMGGTTAKCGLVERLRPDYATQMEIDRGPDANRFLPGSGYLLRVPTIELIEIGSGGGSIAAVDRAGLLQVGPDSAGADPGPVCYARGGTRPTQTDANLALGYFNPEYLVGGEVTVNIGMAVDALEGHIGEPLGIGVTEAAHAVYSIANAKMSRMVKAVTTEKGRDPAGFTMVAFGGCGPAHAVAIAGELAIRRVMIPRWAGVFSAVGLHLADIEQFRTWTYWRNLDDVDFGDVNRWLDRSAEETLSLMAAQGVAPSDVAIVRQADLRYAGQGSELSIEIPPGPLTAASVPALKAAFHDEHLRRYEYRTDEPVELFRLRLVARVPNNRPVITGRAVAGTTRQSGSRRAYFGPEIAWIDTHIATSRDQLSQRPLAGPLIIEEYDTTIVVPPLWRAHLDGVGNVIIESDA